MQWDLSYCNCPFNFFSFVLPLGRFKNNECYFLSMNRSRDETCELQLPCICVICFVYWHSHVNKHQPGAVLCM